MQPRFVLEYYDPPAHLARHLTVLFYFASDSPLIEDAHSGALGQLNVFARGTGRMFFDDYTQDVTAKAHLMSGLSHATRFEMDGPWHVIGATLTPLGWAALTGVPANEHVDRYVPAKELLGAEVESFAEDLSARYISGALEPRPACDALGEWIAARLKAIPQLHEKLIETTIRWLGGSLSPDIEELFSQIAYSRRQAERLVERYFGFPPAAIARKYRAVRAAALLSNGTLSDVEEMAIADAFYDQPHMVREIARYSGYTPTSLGGPEQPIMKTLIQMKNFDRLKEFKAKG